MKKLILFTIAGVALFAGGYWTGADGRWSTNSETPSGTAAARAANGHGPAGEAAKAPPADASEAAVRPFAAGRPFAKGQAKAWLLALAASIKSGGDELPIAMVDAAQVFMTMDESSATEIAGALRELLALYKAGDPEVRAIENADDMAEGAFMLTIFRLSQLNPLAAVGMVNDLPKGTPDEAIGFVFARLASQDPDRAESMLATLDEHHRKDALQGMVKSLSGKDPVAALAMAERHPDIMPPSDLEGLVGKIALRDPQQGIAAGAKIAAGGHGSDALRQAYAAWSQKDAAAATAWAQTYSGPGQSGIQASLVEAHASTDPAAAVNELAAIQAAGRDLSEYRSAAAAIANKLTERDPDTARQWATGLPAGPLRDEALSRIVNQWVREDPASASEWIRTLPEGSERDHASSQLAGSIVRRDPSSAFEWSRSISSPDNREESLREVFEVWHTQDPDAAKAAAAGLPADIRKSLPPAVR